MNFTPTPAQRKDLRVKQNQQLHPVTCMANGEEWQSLVGEKIFFWSWSLGGVSAEARGRYFIFHTLNDLGYYKVHRLLKAENPGWRVDRWSPFKYGKDVALPIPYFISHAVEVVVPDPLTWLEFMEAATRCLKQAL